MPAPLLCLFWESSFYIPIIHKFELFMVSQISCIFCVENLLNLTFSLSVESISSALSSTPGLSPSLAKNRYSQSDGLTSQKPMQKVLPKLFWTLSIGHW